MIFFGAVGYFVTKSTYRQIQEDRTVLGRLAWLLPLALEFKGSSGTASRGRGTIALMLILFS